MLYWGEGSKTRNFLDLTNTDPAALRYFINWVRMYLDDEAMFKLGLHLHEGNDEEAAKRYWSEISPLAGIFSLTEATVADPSSVADYCGGRARHSRYGDGASSQGFGVIFLPFDGSAGDIFPLSSIQQPVSICLMFVRRKP